MTIMIGISPAGSGAVKAAVLLPVILRGEPSLMFTRRTEALARHAGQIAFPGGRVEEEDADHIATALRETEEEVGLTRDLIEVIGRLDTYVTGTGFEITPIVGLVATAFPDPGPPEVAEMFEVPLAFLDEKNHQIQSRTWQGRERRYYAMPYGERYIWGATAGMLKNLQFVLTASH